jgi:hypothetical protein
VRKKRKQHKILVGKPEGTMSLGRSSRRWTGNIKLDLRKKNCRMWTEAVMKTVPKLLIP